MTMGRNMAIEILSRLVSDNRGAMLIEMAIVAPVLILLALGGYDVGQLITRQLELQGGVAEAESIVLAANVGAATNTAELATELRNSLSLTGEEVKITILYRCNTAPTLVKSADACNESDVISKDVEIRLQDDYVPLWTSFGISKTFHYNVVRTVQLGTVEPAAPVEPS